MKKRPRCYFSALKLIPSKQQMPEDIKRELHSVYKAAAKYKHYNLETCYESIIIFVHNLFFITINYWQIIDKMEFLWIR